MKILPSALCFLYLSITIAEAMTGCPDPEEMRFALLETIRDRINAAFLSKVKQVMADPDFYMQLQPVEQPNGDIVCNYFRPNPVPMVSITLAGQPKMKKMEKKRQ